MTIHGSQYPGQGPAAKSPPGVTATQWILALLTLALASGSYLLSSQEELAVLVEVITAVNILLVVSVTIEMFQTGAAGKVILVGSTVWFFWFEALHLALQSPPFTTPSHLPVGWGQYHVDLLQQAFLYVGIFQVMLFVGHSVRPKLRWITSLVTSRVDSPSGTRWVLMYGLAAFAWLPLLLLFRWQLGPALDFLLGARTSVAPAEAAESSTNLLYYISFVGLYGGALLLVELILSRPWSLLWNIVSAVIAIVPYVMGGARHYWLYMAIPLCVIGVRRLRGKITLFRAVRWGAAAVFVVAVVQLQYAVRAVGWQEVGNVTPAQLVRGGTTDQFNALLFAEYLVPAHHDYFLEPAEPYFVINFIPRKFWPEKPLMRSWLYYNHAYTRGARNWNVTPSVIGQFHMNWSIFGVLFIGLWLGFLTCLTDQAFLALDLDRQRGMAVLLGMFYAFIVASFRFYSPIYFTYVVFGTIGMFLLTRAGRSRRKLPINAFAVPEGRLAPAATERQGR